MADRPPEKQEPRRRASRCRLPGRRRWLRLPCIPCHLFSALFFLFVLIMLWLALTR
jgi:hypothetical protein